MMRTWSVWMLLMLAACDGKSDDESEDSDGIGHDPGETDTTPDTEAPPTCSEPGPSACGVEGAVIRGLVSLDPGLTGVSSTGTLFVALTHARLGGGSSGGFYHISANYGEVDLSTGLAEFELDMCAGGEMFSEENCEYNLIVFLDQNGNASATDFTPDAGEPAARISDFLVSCHTESPCVEVSLDCTDGLGCVSFPDPGACSCDPDTCESDISTCF